MENTPVNVNQNSLTTQDQNVISQIVLSGNIGGLAPADKVRYYNLFCQSLGLNPVTQPFQIIRFQGKEILYATKDATEQLRKINGVSVVDLRRTFADGLCVVDVKVQDKTGRTDIATGAVPTVNLKGESLSNAIMKAETKAKRRATLSICGLGALDESELDGMPPHTTKPVTPLPPVEPKAEPELTADQKVKLRGAYEQRDIENEIKAVTTHEKLKALANDLAKYKEVMMDDEKDFIRDAIKAQAEFITEAKHAEAGVA